MLFLEAHEYSCAVRTNSILFLQQWRNCYNWVKHFDDAHVHFLDHGENLHNSFAHVKKLLQCDEPFLAPREQVSLFITMW